MNRLSRHFRLARWPDGRIMSVCADRIAFCLFLCSLGLTVLGVITPASLARWTIFSIDVVLMALVAARLHRKADEARAKSRLAMDPNPLSADIKSLPDYIPQYNPKHKLVRFLWYLATSNDQYKSAFPGWRSYEFNLYMIDRCEQDEARLAARAAAAQAKGHETIAKWCLWREQSERKQAEFLHSRLSNSSSPYY